MSAAVLAGLMSTALFATSMLPMVVRAWRTHDLSSYSRSHLLMTNAGNVVHTVYVASLPVGPVWLLHSFHVVVAATMLVWHLRFVGEESVTLGSGSTRRGWGVLTSNAASLPS
jgi:hypothetical protein